MHQVAELAEITGNSGVMPWSRVRVRGCEAICSLRAWVCSLMGEQSELQTARRAVRLRNMDGAWAKREMMRVQFCCLESEEIA